MPPLPQQTALPVPQNTAGAQPQQASTQAPAAQGNPLDTPEVKVLSKVGADPVKGILDPVQVDQGIKRATWDAYYGAQSPEQFRQYFDSAQIPQETKRALWDLKFKPPISDAQGARDAIQGIPPTQGYQPGLQTQTEQQLYQGAMEQPWSQPFEKALEFGQKYYVDPAQRLRQGAQNLYGGFQEMMYGTQPVQPGFGTELNQQGRLQEQFRSPVSGVARGAGEALGGVVGDPTTWPLMASSEALPLLQKAMSGAFGVQMGRGALEGAQDLYQNWNNYSPAQRAEVITRTGLDAYFMQASGRHAMEGTTGATETGSRPMQREQVQQPTATQARVPTSKPQVGPLQPQRAGYEAAPAPRGQVGTSTAGQQGLRETRTGTEPRPGAPVSASMGQETVAGRGERRVGPQVQLPGEMERRVSQARAGMPAETPVYEGVRQEHARRTSPQAVAADTQARKAQETRTIVPPKSTEAEFQKQRGLDEAGRKIEPTKAPTPAEPTRPQPSTPSTQPRAEAREPVAPEPIRRTEPSTGRTLEQAREIVARGEPKMPKREPRLGAEQLTAYRQKQGEHAKARDEYLAAKAQIAREDAKTTTATPKTEHPLHQTLTRFLKMPGRTSELTNALQAVKPEERQGLASEFTKRAERAEATVKHVKEMQDVQDLDKFVREKLAEPRVLGMETGSPTGVRFVAPKGTGDRTVVGKSGNILYPGRGVAKPTFVREHPQELGEFWNLVRGRAMKEIRGREESGKLMDDLTKHPEVASRVKEARSDLKKVMEEVRQNAGRFTQEQQDRATKALALISAGTGKKQIAGKLEGVQEGAAGEPRAAGTAQTQAWLNAVMGRPRGSHFAKPTQEQLDARIEYLDREGKASRHVADYLKEGEPPKEAAKPVKEAPKTPAKAPEKPVEAAKSEPKAKPRKEVVEPVKTPPKPVPEPPKAKERTPITAPERGDALTKTQLHREAFEDLSKRIDKLPTGEDRDALQDRLGRVSSKFENYTAQLKYLMREREAAQGGKGAKKGQAPRSLNEIDSEIQRASFARAKYINEERPGLESAVRAFEAGPAPKAEALPERAKLQTKVARRLTPEEDDLRREILDLKAQGNLGGKELAEANRMLAELEGRPSEPAPMRESQADKSEMLRQMAGKIKSLEASGKYPSYLEKLKKNYEKLSGKELDAAPSDVFKLAKMEGRLEAKKRAVEKVEPAKETGPLNITRDASDDLVGRLTAENYEVNKLHDKVSDTAKDAIAGPIIKSLERGDMELLDAGRRYNRALDIYAEGARAYRTDKTKPPNFLAKAVEYARTGKIAVERAKETGAVSSRGVGRGSTPGLSEVYRGFYDRIKSSFARNREAANLNDRIQDLRQMKKADILRYGELAKALKGKSLYSRMSDWIEEQNLPADKRTIEPTQEMQERYEREVKPVIEDNTRIIRKLAGKDFKPEDIAGLTHRVALGKGQSVERLLERKMKMGAGKVLSTFSSSRRPAKFEAMTLEGQRFVVHTSKRGLVHVWDGKTDLGTIGFRSEIEGAGAKFGRATSNEISAATGKQYFKHAWLNNVVENIQLRGAERIHDFVENLKKEPEFKKLATTNVDVAKELGFRRARVQNREWLPQFKNYYFEPHIAETLEREWGRFDKGDFGAYENMSNLLKRSIFWNPLLHVPNIANHAFVEKGLTGNARALFTPTEWRALGKSVKVLQDPELYAQHLDAGLPLMRAPNPNDITNIFVTKAVKEIAESPKMSGLAKAFGYANPVQLAKAIYRGASEVTWGVHDLTILQSTYARMERDGLSLQEAAREVTKHIPNYRMPARVWNNRLIGKVMDTPGLSMFSQYHYGAFRSYGEMMKELVAPLKPGDRARALDRMAMLGLMTYAIYPQLDKLAKAFTGDKDAKMRRAGASTFFYNLGKLARGEMGKIPFAESVVTPAPLISAGQKALQAKELTQKGQSMEKAAKKAAQIGAETVGAVAGYESGQKQPGKGRFDWKTFLFKLVGGRFERPVTKKFSVTGGTRLPAMK